MANRDDARKKLEERRDGGKFEEMREKLQQKREGLGDAGARFEDIQAPPEQRKARFQDRLQKMRETRQARGESERSRVTAQWGPVKDNPAMRQELRHHAWRSARLNRLLMLAKAEGKDDAVARIEKLTAKENERHQRAMERFGGPSPAASGSAASPSASHPAHPQPSHAPPSASHNPRGVR